MVNAEIVDGIAVHGEELHFLPVLERGLRRDRPGRHHVTIGQDEPALRVDDESRRLRGGIPLGVECPRTVNLDRDHAGGYPLQSLSPVRGTVDELGRRGDDRRSRRGHMQGGIVHRGGRTCGAVRRSGKALRGEQKE